MNFGVKEWVAVGTVVLSVAWFHWDTRGAVSQNRKDINRIAGALEKTADSLDELVRLDERLKAVEAQVDRMQRLP